MRYRSNFRFRAFSKSFDAWAVPCDVGNRFPDIETAEAQGTYIDQFDAITFNEGFAHLVSYNQQEINTIAWYGDKLKNVYNISVAKMKAALQEKDPQKQEHSPQKI